LILNALAMLICAGGAAMLVPAAYSLVKAPEEAWGLLGAWRDCLGPGRPALLPHAQATSQLRLEAEHVPYGGRVLVGCGARWRSAVHPLGPHGSGGRLLQLHGRLHDHG